MEKYNKELYHSIIINRNAVGEIVNIEVAPNASINEAIPDAIRYLYAINDNNTYIFVYNHARFRINSKSDSTKLISFFIENYNHVTQELSLG